MIEMTETITRRPARKTAAKKATPAKRTAPKAPPTYTIHSMDEIQIDTRVTRAAALSEDEARELTTQIQRTHVRLWMLVTEAHDRKAHMALGYETWADYCKAELGISESRSYQFLDTGHVMKVLAAAGVDVESYSPPPTRVIARIKDRLSDVRRVTAEALKEGDEDGVDTALRALAKEPRKGEAAAASSGGGAAPEPEADDEYEGADEDEEDYGEGEPEVDEDEVVPCPACAGTGRVTQRVADRLLELLASLL